MKTALRVMALATLLTVISMSACVFAFAAEDIPPAPGLFANDPEMLEYGEVNLNPEPDAMSEEDAQNAPQIRTYSAEYGTTYYLDDGGIRSSNIENAPALQINNPVTVPILNEGDTSDGGTPLREGGEILHREGDSTPQGGEVLQGGEVAQGEILHKEGDTVPQAGVLENAGSLYAPNTGYVSAAPSVAAAAVLLVLAVVAGRDKRKATR